MKHDMNSWTEFLTSQGAVFQNNETHSFGESAAQRDPDDGGTRMMDLSHIGVIEARGPDALTFLAGQFTNDLKPLDANHVQLNGYCNAQGRLIALLRVHRYGEAFLLHVPRSLVEGLLKRLRMFVLRAQVSIDDVSDHWVRLGLSGPRAAALLSEGLGMTAPEPGGVTQGSGTIVLGVAGSTPRFEVLAEPSVAPSLWNTWRSVATPVGSGAWRLLDIRSGLPELAPVTSQEFVPQMINLQAIGGISFKKGCYPGQEIVARMQYLSKLKRRMYVGRCADPALPVPGEPLFQGGQETEHKVGMVVSAEPSPNGGSELLAVVEITALGDIHLKGPRGPVVILADPPYPLGSG